MQFPPTSAYSLIGGVSGSSTATMGNMSVEGLVELVDGAVLVHVRGGGAQTTPHPMNRDFETILKEKRTQRQRCKGSGSLRSHHLYRSAFCRQRCFQGLACNVLHGLEWETVELESHRLSKHLVGHSMLHTFDDGSDEVTCAAFNLNKSPQSLYICFCRCFRRHRPARSRSTFGRSISRRGAFLFLLRRCDEANDQRARSQPVLIEPARPFELDERRPWASH